MIANRKKILISLILIAITVIAGASVAFAYFFRTHDETGKITLNTTAETVAVSSFDELFLASKAESYRSSDLSQVGEKTRKTILLTQNVSMTADLEITADVNLDLGGFDLITDGHSLTFRHTYYGSLAVKNGRLVVTASGGYVYADVPNAAVYFHGVTAGTKEGETFTETADTRLIATATSPYFTAYNFFKTVAAAIADETTILTDRKNFGEVTATTFGSSDFITDSVRCAGHGACAYAFSDLDLPFSYYGYDDTKIGYSFASGKFTDKGKLVAGAYGEETLTARITAGGTEYACDFTLHVPDASDPAKRVALAQTMVERYLGRFWVDSTTDEEGNVVAVNKYVINRDTHLPARFSGLGNVSVRYSSYDENGDKTFPADDSVTDEEVVYFVPTTSTVKLKAKITEGAAAIEKDFDMTSSNTVTVRSAVTIANNLLTRWYGTEITVTANGDGTYAFSGASEAAFAGYLPLYDLEYYATADGGAYATRYPGVKSIAYSVVYGNTAEEFYAITVSPDGGNDQRLEVVNGEPENDAGRVFLNVSMTVEFNGKISPVTIQIPVDCKLKGDDSGLGRFLPYYSVFDRTAEEATGGYTTSSFRMPFNYQRDLPFVCYGFAVKNDDGTKLAAVKDALGLTFTDKDGNVTALTAVTKTATLSDGGTDYTLTYLSFSDSLGALLSSSAALAEQIRSGKAYYTITIDPGKIPLDNTDVRLVYEFKTGVTASVWSVYSSFSEFVLPGVIKYGTHVTDPNFYVWLCNVTSDSGETISNPADGILYSDKLKLNVPLDYANSTDAFLRAVTDFTGVKYMVGTQKLNLSGATVSSSVIEEIAQMSSVASIDLSDCSITIAANATNPFAAWGDPSVSKLTNLTTLHLESNTIYSFGWLEPLCSTVARSLTSVYLSGNVPSPTSSASADNVFYGSDGLNNYGTYLELVSAGISVYSGGTKDSPVTFADSRSSSPVYLAMRNLTYQNKLPAGVTVENLLDSFSTTPAHYGLGLTAKNATYSCSLSSVTLSFAKVNETTFSMTYTARVSGGATYTVTLKYSVTLA